MDELRLTVFRFKCARCGSCSYEWGRRRWSATGEFIEYVRVLAREHSRLFSVRGSQGDSNVAVLANLCFQVAKFDECSWEEGFRGSSLEPDNVAPTFSVFWHLRLALSHSLSHTFEPRTPAVKRFFCH